jgi:hypothetical protein
MVLSHLFNLSNSSTPKKPLSVFVNCGKTLANSRAAVPYLIAAPICAYGINVDPITAAAFNPVFHAFDSRSSESNISMLFHAELSSVNTSEIDTNSLSNDSLFSAVSA